MIQQSLIGGYKAASNTYATWNPSDKSASISLSGGNLTATGAGGGWNAARATISKSSGKWYWEITYVTNGGSSYCIPGIMTSSAALASHPGGDVYGYGYYAFNGQKYVLGSALSYGATFTAGDVISIALDLDGGTITYWKNGVSQGTAATSISGTYFPGIGLGNSGPVVTANFGASAFVYSPPGGYNYGIYN